MKWLLVFCLVLALLLSGCAAGQEDQPTAALYFAADGTGLSDRTLVRRDLPYSGEDAAASDLITLLLTAPAPEGAVNLLEGCELLSCRVEESGALMVDLSAPYGALTGLNLSLADACLVRTLLENLDGLQGVHLLCEGSPPPDREDLTYTAGDLLLETLDLQPVSREITVWFPGEDERFLEPETRTVIIRENEEIQRYILDELTAGPRVQGHTDLLRKVPELVLGVSRDRDLCYVNLSSEALEGFHDRFQTEATTLFSIVQSLTGAAEISAVQFLVDGTPRDSFCCLPIGAAIQGDDTLSGAPDAAAGQEAVTLWYPGPDGETLFPLERVVSYREGVSTAQLALESLLSAPVPFWAQLPIPERAEITRFRVQEGICYVEFSPEFLYNHLGTEEGETRIIRSIVATLTEFSAIDSVQCSIQGHLDASYQYFSFDAPLTRAGYSFWEE